MDKYPLNNPPQSSNLYNHCDLNHNATAPKQEQALTQFERIEQSFAAIASQNYPPHWQLLTLHQTAKYFGFPATTYAKAYQLWLEAQGGEG